MEQQVVVEEQVIHEVVVEEPVEPVVIENTSLGEVVLGNLVDLEEACLQGQTFSLMVADVDSDQPDTYSLSLI